MGETPDTDDPMLSRPSAIAGVGVIDWRTIDPSTIRENGRLVEELLTYREKLGELTSWRGAVRPDRGA